ncbi:hypothetical protein PENTCL1PPCAC_2853 [Pristionchus entomophagus]|uniref:protein-tyrosine-phosphatase n=1 Tax=Pristionchus entomophagus TaxID=358040 RepID=A0AAV5SER7_9BILA|nr:hypothetical protein PENTCL1PPCAC_2853 [Pristionchus entomophagus]
MMSTRLTGADFMHRAASSLVLLQHGRGSSDDCSSSQEDSGLGSECSSSSHSSAAGAAGPTDFAGWHSIVGGTQRLSREMESMHIKSGKTGRNERMAKAHEEIMELDEGIMHIMDGDDENAQDCPDSSFTLMPPPALPPTRRVLGDVGNRMDSPVSSKRYSRNATMPTMSASSTGGLRNRKRSNVSASPFGSKLGKRWRVEEAIDEHSETASTSYVSRTHSVDCRTEDRWKGETTVSRPAPRHAIHRIQSMSVLEKGIYAHHHDEHLPAHLEVSYGLDVVKNGDGEHVVTSQAYRRITAHTLRNLMHTLGDDFEKSYALIDCRYPFEFEGGHIKGATNVFDPSAVDDHFFSETTSLLRKEGEEENEEGGGGRKIPIFYCEFSQMRGPNMAEAVRAFDRIRNYDFYPRVDHAEMYVLNEGYRGFHASQGCMELCSPADYIHMLDERFTEELSKFPFHKKKNGPGTTVSRINFPHAKQARRALQAQQQSPIAVGRRPSRRALYAVGSPPRPAAAAAAPPTAVAPLPNPQFS